MDEFDLFFLSKNVKKNLQSASHSVSTKHNRLLKFVTLYMVSYSLPPFLGSKHFQYIA